MRESESGTTRPGRIAGVGRSPTHRWIRTDRSNAHRSHGIGPITCAVRWAGDIWSKIAGVQLNRRVYGTGERPLNRARRRRYVISHRRLMKTRYSKRRRKLLCDMVGPTWSSWNWRNTMTKPVTPHMVSNLGSRANVRNRIHS